MNVLAVMEEEYREGKEALHDPVPDDQEEPVSDNEPGFLRRAGGAAGRGVMGAAAAAGGAAAYSLMRHTTVLGGMAKMGIAAFGMAKSAKKLFSSSKSSSSSPRGASRGLFGMGGGSRNAVRPKQTDFTPREEQLEGNETVSILQRIEENTAKLLSVFGGKPAKDGKGGIMGMLSGLLGTLGTSIAGLFSGPLMMAAMVALGGALAIAFGKTAVDYLCKQFPALCPTNSNLIDSLANTLEPVSQAAQKAAQSMNRASGKELTIDRQRAKNKAGQMPLEEREAKVHDALANVRLNGKAYSPEQIAGIMGSMKGENSTFDPTATNKSSGAFGIMQLVGHRKQLYFDWVKNKEGDKDPYSIENQIKFQEYEYSVGKNVKPTGYTGTGHFNEKKNYDKLLASDDVGQVARLYGSEVMRFNAKKKDGSYADPLMTDKNAEAHMQKRVNWAKEFYPEVVARGETGKVKLLPKGKFEVDYSEPVGKVYQKRTSIDDAIKSYEDKLKNPNLSESDRNAFLGAIESMKRSKSVSPSSKMKAPRSITAPSWGDASSNQSGDTTVINAPKTTPTGPVSTAPMSLINNDRSLLAMLREDGNTMFSTFG